MTDFPRFKKALEYTEEDRYISDSVFKFIDSHLKEIIKTRSEIRELFCKTFLATLKPEDLTTDIITKLELCEVRNHDGFTWFIRFKE